MYVEFGDKVIEISDDYKVVNIYTEKYTLTTKLNDSFYEVNEHFFYTRVKLGSDSSFKNKTPLKDETIQRST